MNMWIFAVEGEIRKFKETLWPRFWALYSRLGLKIEDMFYHNFYKFQDTWNLYFEPYFLFLDALFAIIIIRNWCSILIYVLLKINLYILCIFIFLCANYILYFTFFLINISEAVLIILGVLISVAYFTLVERKVLSFMQRRRGPNVVGFFGLLQPIADGVKLILKETILPFRSNKVIFNFAPILTFFLSLLPWAIIPFNYNACYVDLDLGVFYLLAVSSLGVYGIIYAGWSSNSKYPFLGALRSTAQMISYEVSFALILLVIFLNSESLNLYNIIIFQIEYWYVYVLFPSFIMFFISILAETNRPPFDLPEAEAELVSGYNVEYSAMTFALFFLAEYSNMLVMSCLVMVFFLGGWSSYLGFLLNNSFLNFIISGLKICLAVFIFVWVRAAFPRLRYDQLMSFGWKILLPLSLGYFLFIASIYFFS